ncbi:MAG: hypothetical protein K2G97_00460, partial [Oscillospiraceae bacterium]|nr:hypothetical protein [Oscillospiraceae bacterium]
TNLGKITKCSTAVPVNSKDIAGGFCGSNSGEINDCKAEGSVKAKASNGITICGGFVGENSGMIKNCSSKGNVEGQEFTGGFAGINGDKGEMISSKAKCDVKSHTYIASINCGGFVGLDAGKIEDCSFEGRIDGCVDSEKVVGIAVGVTVGIVLAITITYLFCKYKQSMFEKQREDFSFQKSPFNDEETIMNPETSHGWNIFLDHVCTEYEKLQNPGFSLEQSADHPEFLKYVFEKYKNEYLQHEDKNVRIWANIIDKIYYYKSIKSIILSILAGTVLGGATSGVTIEFTACRKCANIGAFCGVNTGEIRKCSANNRSLKAKSMYNKHNMCGGFVGINGETGTIKDGVATGNEISNKTYTGGHLGGFVGENSGKIENGTTTISVDNGKYTGGFCGNNTGEIIGSRSEGNAVANAKIVETKCGGFVGNNKKGIVDSCISIGSAEGQEHVGGFCGDNTGEISKSKSEGNAKAKTVSNINRCGGFVGENKGTVKDSSSKGSAEGQEYVGGFCGDNTGEISKSKAEGNAKASTKVNTNRCGGFIGENSGNINDCNSTGSAIGEEYVGGFVGVNKSEIVDCNAYGKATAKTKIYTALAGGFVGENEKGTIISCTAKGGADSRSSSGQAKAGGFVGINKANIVGSRASGFVYLSA